VRALVIGLALGAASRSAAQPIGQLLCSAGAHDGATCAQNGDCPGGACVLGVGVCDGGNADGTACDCPGGVCRSTPACADDPHMGTCAGGTADGQCCEVTANCGAGQCQPSYRVCAAGSKKGFACLRDAPCPDSHCAATGRACTGDVLPFACVDTADCPRGTCTGPQPVPTDTPTLTRTPSLTPTTPSEPCVGDCRQHGAVDLADLVVMVDIALAHGAADACVAGDADQDGRITVDEILRALNQARDTCAGGGAAVRSPS